MVVLMIFYGRLILPNLSALDSQTISCSKEPPTIDAGRLMPDTLMPITLMPVTIHAHEALLMPVTFDARHF